MNKYAIYSNFYDAVDRICQRASFYKQTGKITPHFLINAQSEYEQKSLLCYMTDCYEYAGVQDYSMTRKKYLYFRFDGSTQQLKRVFSTIQRSAGTANHYSYVVGFDITKLMSQYNELLWKDFFAEISIVSRHANCVFFTASFRTANAERFIAKLSGVVSNFTQIIAPDHGYTSLAEMATDRLQKLFSVSCTITFTMAFASYLRENGVIAPESAFDLSEAFLSLADDSIMPPVLNATVFKKINNDNFTRGDQNG